MTAYIISYRTVGGKHDIMTVFANSIIEAIKEFEELDQETAGYHYKYTSHAIENIRVN